MGLCVEYTRFRVGIRIPAEEDELETDAREKTEVYLVGRREEMRVEVECPTCHRPTIAIYHIQGVTVASGGKTAEQIAWEMCRDETYFIGPLPVNVMLPHERCDWPGAYFPLRPPEKAGSPPVTCLPVVEGETVPDDDVADNPKKTREAQVP